MTALRRRMTEELQLRGYADRTVEAYLRAVSQLAAFYRIAPDRLTEEQIRDYLVHLATVEKVAASTFTQALCGIKFLYEQTLGRRWAVLDIARPKRADRLPVILSHDEVRQVLAAVRAPQYRVCLTVMYACGLRLREGLALQVSAVDGARKLLHVRSGKGGKDRLVPIPDAALTLLRQFWRTHRDPLWLFPPSARARRRQHTDTSAPPIHATPLQRAFTRAVRESGVRKKAHVHTLRHSYATHLLEAGVPVVLIITSGTRVPRRPPSIRISRASCATRLLDPINGLMSGL